MQYMRDSHAIVTHPINQACSKETAPIHVAILLHIRTSLVLELTLLEAGRYEHFALVCEIFVSVCGNSNVLE